MTRLDSEPHQEDLDKAGVGSQVDSMAGEAGMSVAMDRHSTTTTTATRKATKEDGQHTCKTGKKAGKEIITLLRPPVSAVSRLAT